MAARRRDQDDLDTLLRDALRSASASTSTRRRSWEQIRGRIESQQRPVLVGLAHKVLVDLGLDHLAGRPLPAAPIEWYLFKSIQVYV